MNDLLDRYGALLREVDDWFQRCLDLYPDKIVCRNGCSECCRGLFDITLLDALYLKRAFDDLPDPQKTGLLQLASRRLEKLSSLNSAFVEPWLLNGIPESDWELLMPEEDETPCLLLSEAGGCLLYEFRPMTCRLNGIPLFVYRQTLDEPFVSPSLVSGFRPDNSSILFCFLSVKSCLWRVGGG